MLDIASKLPSTEVSDIMDKVKRLDSKVGRLRLDNANMARQLEEYSPLSARNLSARKSSEDLNADAVGHHSSEDLRLDETVESVEEKLNEPADDTEQICQESDPPKVDSTKRTARSSSLLP